MNADEEEDELVPPTGTVKVEEWISMAVGLVKLVWDPPENSLRCRPLLFEQDDATLDESEVTIVASLHFKLSTGEVVVVSEMNSGTWKKQFQANSDSDFSITIVFFLYFVN